jgi:hypothetical protein
MATKMQTCDDCGCDVVEMAPEDAMMTLAILCAECGKSDGPVVTLSDSH